MADNLDGKKKYLDIHAAQSSQKAKLLVAGATAGGTSRAVISPLYRVTVMFQLADMQFSRVPEHYRRKIVPALRSMYQNEGVRGLWRGNLTHMAKKVPFAAIKFTSYERYKQLITREGVPSPAQRMTAGAMAALTAASLTYPLDLIQTRVTALTSDAEFRGRSTILGVASKVVQQDGVPGLYRGLGVTLASVVPYMAMNLGLWEVIKVRISRSGTTEASPVISSVAGAASSAIASTVTFPLDLVRRRMQVSQASDGRQLTYTMIVRHTWDNHGLRGFYRGCAPHYLTVMPAVAISMGVYDLMKIILSIN